MFQHQGVWLPDGEQHFVEWMTKSGEIVDGRGTYQIRKLRAALDRCAQFRTAVDVGGHVGLWSMQLVKRFDRVVAFEPVAAFRECFKKNVCGDVTLCPYAVGAGFGQVSLKIDPTDTGGTHIDGAGDIELRPLDSFDLEEVDFLKIDCEGYERAVIEGGRETIRRCRPTIIVEQKQHIMARNYGAQGTPAVDLLKSMGYTVRAALSGDYILTADGA